MITPERDVLKNSQIIDVTVISALFYHRFLNVVIRMILQNSASIPLIPECYISALIVAKFNPKIFVIYERNML